MSEPTPDQAADEPVSEFRARTARAAVLKALHTVIGDAYSDEMKNQASPVRDELIKLHKHSGGKTHDIDLGDLGKVGTVTLPVNQDAIDVDEKTLLRWVKAFYPGEVETVEQVRPAFLGALKARVIGDYKTGDVYDPVAADGGEAVVVLGMKARKGEGYGTPSVKLASGMVQRIFEAVRGRSMLELTAAPAAAKATSVDSNGVVIIDAEVVEDAPVDYTPEQLDGMKRPAVIQVCKDLGLSHTGSLAVLRARILDHQRRTAAEPVVEPEAQAAADKIGEALIAKAKGDAQ